MLFIEDLLSIHQESHMKTQDLNAATKNEISFIKKLGTGEWSTVGARAGKRNCLRGYIRRALLRSNWGKIDGALAIKIAASLLSKVR